MSDQVADITPLHEPIALVKDMMREATGSPCSAAVGVLVKEGGLLWYDSAGHSKATVLWALQKMIHELMTAEDDD